MSISIGNDSVLNGQVVTLPVILQKNATTESMLDSLHSLDFLVCYDNRVLSFIDAVPGEGISEWEYFTYRHSNNLVKKGPTSVRFVSWRNLDNGAYPNPPQYIPEGILFHMSFYVTADRDFIGQTGSIEFCAADCQDNTLSPGDDPETLLIQYYDDEDPEFRPMYDTLNCPRRYLLQPALEFHGGFVYIDAPPSDRILVGDIDLDGIAMTIADAVLFANFFIHGVAVFESDPHLRTKQIAATDINGDGISLTWEDYQLMVRIIDVTDPP